MRSLGGSYSDMTGGGVKRGNWRETCAQEEHHVNMRTEVGVRFL